VKGFSFDRVNDQFRWKLIECTCQLDCLCDAEGGEGAALVEAWKGAPTRLT